MTTKMVQINCETNEVIEREMSADEIEAEKAMQDCAQEAQTLNLAKEASRVEILNRLGITADEAKLLLS